jgi:hypothetical protein
MSKLTHSRLRLNNDITLIVYKYLHMHRLKKVHTNHAHWVDDLCFNRKELYRGKCYCCGDKVYSRYGDLFCGGWCYGDYIRYNAMFLRKGDMKEGIIFLEYTIEKQRKKNNQKKPA